MLERPVETPRSVPQISGAPPPAVGIAAHPPTGELAFTGPWETVVGGDRLAPLLARAVAERAPADYLPARAVCPDTSDRRYSDLGKAGVTSDLLRSRRPTERVHGSLLQREGEDDDVAARAEAAWRELVARGKAALSEFSQASLDTVGAFSNVAGGVGTAFKAFPEGVNTKVDVHATAVGGVTGLLGSVVEGVGIGAESHAAWRDLLDPTAPESEQNEAHQTIGDCVQRGWRLKDKVARDALALGSVFTTNPPLVDLGSRAAVPVVDFWNLYMSVLTLARNTMELADVQELQFAGWADPERAAVEARREGTRAAGLLRDAQATAVSATELHMKNKAALDESEYGPWLERAEKSRRRFEAQIGIAGASLLDDLEAAWQNDAARRDKLRPDQDVLERRCAESLAAVFAANEAVSSARKLVMAATEKQRALKTCEAELRKAAHLRRLDPALRQVSLSEIGGFVTQQLGRAVKADNWVVAGSVIAAGAGLSIVALGWTPLGWILLGTAGAIVVGAQLFKVFKDRSARLVYAERLWSYVEHGYDIRHASKPPRDIRRRGRSDALELLKRLGIVWSGAALPEKARGIEAIANAMKGGGEGV